MRLILLLPALLLSLLCVAQPISIIPQPAALRQPKIAASFTITPATVIVLEGSNLEGIAGLLNQYLQSYYNFTLKTTGGSSSENTIRLNYERLDNAVEGAYTMAINKNGVYIAGDNEPGVFYGIQTLLQLLPVTPAPASSLKIPYCSIEDHPRFAWRGMHLDVGRHFFPVSFVKKYIDYLALHKMNYFHWHLTDDQGWRIEIKKYPQLTTVGAWRNGTITGRYPGTGNDSLRYGGFYTQDQIKEVVKYAAERYITVIPEIEMPGHSSAAIAAYPSLSCFPDEPTRHPPQCAWAGDTTGKQVQQTWGVFDDVFCAGKETTFTFLQDVLDEVLPLFPSIYIHVGGDECPKSNWKRCPLCQQRMKENNLKDEHELQSYFIQRMEKYLNGKGKTLIGWDEILEGGLAPNAVVMSWRGESGGMTAARQKHNVIMTPQNPVYFDYTQSLNEDSVTIGGYNPLEKVYAYEPIPKTLAAPDMQYVLGAQANVWTEYMSNERKIEYMVFPRMSALSEVLWSSLEKRNWNDFNNRLQAQLKRYELWNANYSKANFDLKAIVLPSPGHKGVIWRITKANTTGSLRIGNGKVFSIDNRVSVDYKITDSSRYGAYEADWIQVNMIQGKFNPGPQYHYLSNPLYQQFYFNKATGKKITLITPASEKYPGDGAFTLVNGVENKKQLARSNEFLGFPGTDCKAIIDLGNATTVDSVTIHILNQTASWIWPPSGMAIAVSQDGKKYKPIACGNSQLAGNKITCILATPAKARYIKITIRNHGVIEEGNPGAGTRAWLFVDEIEIR